jgi:monothiol glutaredoxin
MFRLFPTHVFQRSYAFRCLSQQARSQIKSAISSSPVVLFMKGTPQLPECGFSRAVVQVLGLHGVSAENMRTFNVLADDELRSGIKEFS